MTTNTSLTLHFLLPSLFFFSFFLLLKHKKPKSPPLPPGPTPWPIVGNLPHIFFNKPAFRWILALMKDMNTDIACIRLGKTHVIPVTCPAIAREFLKTHDAIFASRPLTMGTEYSSRGFLNVTSNPSGDQWKKMRRVVATELMTRPRVHWLVEKEEEESNNLVRYLYERCNRDGGGAVVDVREVVRQHSGNVIRKMMFNGRYFGPDREDGEPGFEELEHVEALFTVVSLEYSFAIADYMPWLRLLDLDGHEKEMKRAIGVVNKYHEPLIDERIRKWRRGDDDGRLWKAEPEDLLDMMILVEDADGKPLLTPDEIKALVADLSLATVDNPPNAVEWAIAEMLNQPHILQRAVEELDRVVGKERLVQESDIPQLNYIKACATEAFRIHPIAPFNLPHMSTADAIIAGHFIPKGSQVILSRTGLGRNPKVWHDPLLFMPERHLNGESTQVELVEPDLRFISFSTGRRGCMGAPLGSTLTIMLLARLLQGFSWTVPKGEPPLIDLTESTQNLFLAKPLHAHPSPRLPSHVYSTY